MNESIDTNVKESLDKCLPEKVQDLIKSQEASKDLPKN